MTKKITSCIIALAMPFLLIAQTATKLSGTIIGSQPYYNYLTNGPSMTVNTLKCAFDGNYNTFYASYKSSNTWVGLDLYTPHRITKVGWAARKDDSGPRNTRLAIFEGANREDFLDAIPLYMTTEDGTSGKMQYANISSEKAFRYVRYIGPNESHCNISSLEFYGIEADGSAEVENTSYYKPTNLPLISIHVKDAQEPYDKVNDLEMITSIISADGHSISTLPGTIRLRGNASLEFPKKPYRLKFEDKTKVLGSPAKAKKWTLISNYGDKTLMRNMLAFDISRRVGMEYTPFCTPVDVMVNGEYKGCYQLCDQIEVGTGRVDVEKMDENCVSGEALTGGYLIEVDAYANEEISYFISNRQNPVTIKYPSDDDILPVQAGYIKGIFNRMENSLYSQNFKDAVNGYRKYLDLESFLKHFLVGELSGNTDTYWSVYMYKHRGEDILHVGPVWDFDLAFDNDYRTYPVKDLTDFIYATDGSCAGNMRDFVNRIIKNDPEAFAQLKQMWTDLRNSDKISEQQLLRTVDDYVKLLNQSQTINFMRWDILSDFVHMNPIPWETYEGEVDCVRNFIINRVKFLDDVFGYDATGIKVVKTEGAPDGSCEVYNAAGNLIGRYESFNDAKKHISKGLYIIRNSDRTFKYNFR